MECKHDISLLMGTKDGIVCRGCGKLFASFDDILADRGEAPVEEKKAPAKKTASKKAKKEE